MSQKPLITLLILISTCIHANEWSNLVLMKASVESSVFHSNLSNENRVVMGDLYNVKLKVENVVEGKLNQSHVEVLLAASNPDQFKLHKYIYLLVNKEGGKITAIEWSPIREVVYFSKGVIEKHNLENDFFIDDSYTRTKCSEINIR